MMKEKCDHQNLELEAETLAQQAATKAAFLDEPEFPQEFGRPVAKYWLKYEGVRAIRYLAEPEMPHLTVWQFEGFEVTATYDQVTNRREDRERGIRFAPVAPPVGAGWKEVGPTTRMSTLWRREVV